jgi:hypothetical protein
MPTVYIETSIVSYLRQCPSSQVVMAARQVLTHRWWNHERANYVLVTSQYVIEKPPPATPHLPRNAFSLWTGFLCCRSIRNRSNRQ